MHTRLATFQSLGISQRMAARLEEHGLRAPTEVQRAAIPPLVAGRDALLLAPTGTGKTLAYLLPVVEAILADKPREGSRLLPADRVRALILCPTRELAMQVNREAEWLIRGTVLHSCVLYGKSPMGPQRAALADGPDIVVGTPGRVRDFIHAGDLPTHAMSHVVVDEADRLWDMGFAPQVQWILERVPPTRRMVGATATLPAGVAGELAAAMRDPVRVEAAPPNTLAASGSGVHGWYDISDDRKIGHILHLIIDGKRKGIAIYARTRRRAGWVAEALRTHGLSVSLLHGDIPQRKRTQELTAFAGGSSAVLVATDVAARGLHVQRLRCVVNYDVPLMPEDFVHRVGRAGHGGGRAESITFVSPEDADRWHRVQQLLASAAAPDVVERLELPSVGAKAEAAGGSRAPDAEGRGSAGAGHKGHKGHKGRKGRNGHKGRKFHRRDEPRKLGALKQKPGRAARAPISGKPGSGVRGSGPARP